MSGFDIATPYEGEGVQEWNQYLRSLDPQTACRLCGIDHFPHWLASAANWKLLIDFLKDNYPPDTPIKKALALAIQERRPAPHSEEAPWWLAMKHTVPDLERFAYLYSVGIIKPQSDIMLIEVT